MECTRKSEVCIFSVALGSFFCRFYRVGQLYLEHGYQYLKTTILHCPPENTAKGWAVKSILGGEPARPGRPSHLSVKEETILAATVRDLRSDGGVIDRETLIYLGKQTMREVCCPPLSVSVWLYLSFKQVRGPETDFPTLTKDWVRAFRHRHSLGRLRRASSDRLRSTGEQLREDNLWREYFESLVKSPFDHGMGGIEGLPIPERLQLGADETPILYMPQVRGTYESVGVKQVQILGGRERRMITGTPVTSRAGDLHLMQMLWKGKTQQVREHGLVVLVSVLFFCRLTPQELSPIRTCTTTTRLARCRTQPHSLS